MTPVRQLIQEIHRRSLWQVTGIFLAASWGALQVIETITETAGLPDWTPSMALVLLIIYLVKAWDLRGRILAATEG